MLIWTKGLAMDNNCQHLYKPAAVARTLDSISNEHGTRGICGASTPELGRCTGCHIPRLHRANSSSFWGDLHG
jgi:hypothetical protein